MRSRPRRYGLRLKPGTDHLSGFAPGSHRLDESAAGYSLAGCAPAEPTSASPGDYEYAVQSSCRSRSFHRTADSVLTVCVRLGGKLIPYQRTGAGRVASRVSGRAGLAHCRKLAPKTAPVAIDCSIWRRI